MRRLGGRGLQWLGSLLLGVCLTAFALAQEATSRPPVVNLVVDGSSVRLGERTLRHPLREDDLATLLGPPERSRYRLLWPGQGVFALSSEGEVEELVFVLCDGAAERVRVGLFPGTVRLDGVELSCSRSAAETREALPEDFSVPGGLEAFLHAQRPGVQFFATMSSWAGVLTLSMAFEDPDPTPARPELRVGADSPP